MKTKILSLALISATLLFTACQKDGTIADIDDPIVVDNGDLGFGANLNEDDSKIPSDLFLANGNVPSRHDIMQWVPPVQSQGNYGTCVAWALGYNLKTIIEAQDKGFTANDLYDENKRFSAKDLFLSIDKSDVGQNCGGTYLSSAFNVMQSRGVATEAVVPYTGLGDCSQSPSSAGNSNADNYKISNFRRIDHDVATIKQYLANDRPIGFGARLSDVFMSWNSDDVITGHTSFDRVGQHAGHAMTLVGYDDNRGPNGAFRIVNSWGDDWGSQGFLWMDYNFFVSSDFLHTAYVATNSASDVDPDDPIDPTSRGEVDMVPWGLQDNEDSDGNDASDRTLSYNVYNVGTETASADEDWSVAYIYYNAYDANDYGVLLYDYYSNDHGSRGQNGEMTSGPGTSGNWWNHVDVAGNSSISEAVNGTDNNFSWSYSLPNITGFYYLIMIADPFENLKETDVTNNYYYMTDGNGYPILFENGIPRGFDGGGVQTRGAAKGEMSAAHMSPAEVNPELMNAYSKTEISKFLGLEKENGRLTDRIRQYQKAKK